MRSEAIDKDVRRIADIYAAYEKLLHQSNALDFDDLLSRTVKLLRESTPVREKWQSRFQYIHVDEYQDTNRVQYELLRLLTSPKQNLCVVGDEDQSIYRWRGADVSILMRFSRDFPSARVIKLERNYRSAWARRPWTRYKRQRGPTVTVCGRPSKNLSPERRAGAQWRLCAGSRSSSPSFSKPWLRASLLISCAVFS